MKLRGKYVLIIVLLVILEGILITVIPILKSQKYPLLSDLNCVQTEDINDLYWNINQIDLSASINRKTEVVKISLYNNVPNFDSYYLRTNDGVKWTRTRDAEVDLKLREGENIVEIKARNRLGGETAVTVYKIIKDNDNLKIFPEGNRIIDGKYRFNFETYKSPKIEWLRQYTLPVIEGSSDQWEKYMSLKKWVKEQIPYKESKIESHWDAKRILRTVWSNSSLGFLCDAYAATYTSACISVGLNARVMHLKSREGNGHYVTEIWSDDYRKWIFIDPLYDCYFTMGGEPLSTLELHNLLKTNKWEGVVKRYDDKGKIFYSDVIKDDYINLFHDIKLVNSNNFLSDPFNSVLDLLTFRIRYIRWIDESNPKYNKAILATKLILFYYLPKISEVFIIPVLIPFLIVFIIFNKRDL